MTAANNPNFNPDKYTTIASNHLVIYSIHTLYKDGDEISAEDIISACFMLFPKKFSLRTYPQWPDSALVGRRLHNCEKSGWLTARIDTGFKLTAKGIRLAERVAKELGVAIPKREKPRHVHKLRVDKLQVAEAKPVGKLRVDKLQVTEAKPVGELQVDKLQVTETAEPTSITPKPVEEAKTPVVEAPKAVEKVVAPIAKPAPVKPKPEEKAKAPVVEAPKQEVKVIKPVSKLKVKPRKRVGKLQVTEAVKPAPVTKPRPTPKAKAPVIKAPKQEVKVIKPVSKTKVKPRKRVGKLQVTEAVKPAPIAKPAPVKTKPADKPKPPVIETPKPVEKKAVVPVAKAAPVKPKPAERTKPLVVKAPKPVEKKATSPVAKPAPTKPKVEKAKVVETPKAKVLPPSTVHRQLSLLPTVSAEEKARAGKFVRMMEASDAYRLYKKNGSNANIGEFDFRSLLLCTMESSHETLARNVELFKGYAGIHNRQDLVTFLAFCREKFAHLLLPEKKAVRKLR